MKFAIIISTYQRSDGSTPYLLKRTLSSVYEQSYSDYKIFLIGDRYENEDEFIEICETFNEKEKIYYENLDIAKERDLYRDKQEIWKFGGASACNYAINIAEKEGYRYILKLDHDDFWEKNHIKTIKNCIESTGCSFVCTKSRYGSTILPDVVSNLTYIDFLPQPQKLVHSSICFDLVNIPIRYRTSGDEKCGNECGDGCLYLEITELVTKNNLKSILVNEITCNVEGDGFFLRN